MTAVIEVALGLGFVFLTFSLIASTIVEWASALRDRRSRFLKDALRASLGADLAAEVLRHPIIDGLGGDAPGRWRSVPEASYLPPKAVALALADIARRSAPMAPPPGLVRLVRALESDLDTAGAGAQALAVDGEVLFRIERWFVEQMDRTTAGYKRWTQLWTVLIGLCLSLAFDLDAGRIATHLSENAAVRSALAATATNELATETLSNLRGSVGTLADLPVGWSRSVVTDGRTFAVALVGWAISTIAIGLGAPFWFDLLNRLVSLRQTGPRPEARIVGN
jgi:hypothetical protein